MGVVYSRTKPIEDLEKSTTSSQQSTSSLERETTPEKSTENEENDEVEDTSSKYETAMDTNNSEGHARQSVETSPNLSEDPPDIQPPEEMEVNGNETSVVMDMCEEFTPPRFSTPLRAPLRTSQIVGNLPNTRTMNSLRTVHRLVLASNSSSPSSALTQTLTADESRIMHLDGDSDNTIYSVVGDDNGTAQPKHKGGRPRTRNPTENVILINENPPTYQCKVCKRQFKTKANSYYHEFCGKEAQLPYKCDTCNLGFRSKGHLHYHLRTKHNVQIEVRQPFSCNVCPKKFAVRKHLEQHLKQHLPTDSTQNMGPCSENSVMNTIFDIGGDAGSSQPPPVVEKRPLQCQKCNKRYKRNDYWARHVEKCQGDLHGDDRMMSQSQQS